MDSVDNAYVAEFDKSLEGWTDERFATRDELRDLAMFGIYLVNLAESDGWTYDGHSLKVGAPMSMLTVRATIDGVAHVAFSSGKTTTACIHSFLRKMDGGYLEWRPDRYR